MKVLVAEDDRVSRRLLTRAVSGWGYQVVEAIDGDQAWEILQQDEAPPLVIMDWEMPGWDGVEICRHVRQLHREPYTYILLLTARKDQQDIIDGLQAGADDYITKPFDKHELEVRLRTGKRIIKLQKELIEARERLRIMARHDPLTGLYNRGAIFEQLQTEISRARRSSTCLTIVLGDVDHFKSINDTHGHLVGDEVLRSVAQRLNQSSRDYDAVGRYGGEEFLALVPGCPPDCALDQANRLHQAVRSRPVETEQGDIPVTISLGVAVCNGDSLPDAETLIHAADEALYRAKEAGRDRVEIGHPEAVPTG